MILNDNSTQQINTLVIQLQNKITNLTNEFRKLNNNIDDLNSEISDLEKRISSNENDADNNIGDLNSEISDLERRVSSNENNAAAMNAEILANTEAISGKADKNHTHTKSQITDFPTSLPANGGTADSANNGFNSSTTTDSTPGWGYLTSANGYSNGRTYGFANGGGIATAEKDTKSSLQVDGDLYVHEGLDKVATLNDIPISLPANGGTANYANVPTGFEKIGNQDDWGNQDGLFITDWRTFLGEDGGGDISFRFNKGQLNVIIDGVFYQNEGKYKLVDENSLKDIMKPNYTTGRLPAGVYKAGQAVSVSASITTTRGNPVFISYSGDYNSVNQGSTVPWIAFELFVDDQIVQRTSIDNSVALESDNTPFAGNALAVLSAGKHTIRLAASLIGDASGQIQFQEQDNLVNLVAFEL